MRFTHANRHCPDHPYATLTRSDDFVLKPVTGNTELPHDVTRWLERYKMSREREDRTPTSKNDRKKKGWKCGDGHKRSKSRKGLMMDGVGEQENLERKRLYCGESQDSQEESQDEDPTENCTTLQTSEDEDNNKLAITPVRRSLDRLQPKKRWLREACREQQLAKPLRWDPPPVQNQNVHFTDSDCSSLSNFELPKSEIEMLDSNANSEISWDQTAKVPPVGNEVTVNSYDADERPTNHLCWDERWEPDDIPRENEMRPTVLMLAGSCAKESSPKTAFNRLDINERNGAKVLVIKEEEQLLDECGAPEDNQKWLGAMALMELAKTQQEAERAMGLKRESGSLILNANKQYTHL